MSKIKEFFGDAFFIRKKINEVEENDFLSAKLVGVVKRSKIYKTLVSKSFSSIKNRGKQELKLVKIIF